MWTTIINIFATMLPQLIKLVLYLIERGNSSDKSKEELLKFIDAVQDDIPIRLHDKYKDQIAKIKEQLKEEKGKLS